MLLTVGQVKNRLKDEYEGATAQVVPAPSLARHLSAYQKELMQKAFLIDDEFKSQQASIVFDVADDNDPAVVGRGTSGGLPVIVEDDGDYVVIRQRTGSLVEYDFTTGMVLVPERKVVGHAANYLDALGTAWVVNAYANKIVRIVTGKGSGSAPRVGLSNTATRIVVTQNWEIEPDDTSTFEVLEVAADVTSGLGVATSTDPTRERTGYLVKEDVNGIAYIDYTNPLRATLATGIPLPPHLRLLGGDVRYAPSSGLKVCPLELGVSTHKGRSTNLGLPSAYVTNGELFLAGAERMWKDATSIDLRIVPIPPDVYKDTDAFLLSDAESPLVARATLYAHKQAKSRGIKNADPAEALSEFKDAESTYLSALSGRRPATVFKRRDTFSRR